MSYRVELKIKSEVMEEVITYEMRPKYNDEKVS